MGVVSKVTCSWCQARRRSASEPYFSRRHTSEAQLGAGLREVAKDPRRRAVGGPSHAVLGFAVDEKCRRAVVDFDLGHSPTDLARLDRDGDCI
jgi:hypothetical protein